MNGPASDRERRRPVWEAVSELFLDTELQEQDFTRIAHVMVASGYSDQELEWVLDCEVLPVCLPNLLSPAGEWQSFDVDWLERGILAQEQKRSMPARLWGRWRSLLYRRYIRRDWDRVMGFVRAERQKG